MVTIQSPSPFSKLCQKCKVLELDEKSLPESALDTSVPEYELALDWELVPRIDVLDKKACDFCHLVSSIVSSPWEAQSDLARLPKHNRRVSLCYVIRQKRLEALRVKIHHDRMDDVYFHCPIASPTAHPQGSPLGLKSPLTHLDHNPLAWMQSKINSCVTHNHTRPQRNFVPDRLIRVDQDKLSLVLTKDSSNSQFHRGPSTELPYYAALTYCWGPPPHSDRQLKTYQTNLSDHMREIPEDKLPQAIKDAVLVTRALSIPYLWVDALCILQDVGSDWDHQCTQMDNIYGNAHVTISAAVSKNCEEGFITRKDMITVPFHLRDVSVPPISISIHFPSYHKTTSEDIAAATWVNRGWTFQERMASTRMLMFGKSNVHFQCRDDCFSMSKYQLDYHFSVVNRDLLNEGDTGLIYEEWATEVAMEFSAYGLEFTRGTDILPSIAGLATLFSHRLHDDYLAGLWKTDLYRCLKWDLHRPGVLTGYKDLLDGLQHPTQYIAPSWSWASKSGLVMFPVYWGVYIKNARSECAVLEAVVQLKGTSAFGEVTGGYLDISAKLYTGSRQLVYQEMDDGPGIARQTLHLGDEYLVDIETDCILGGLFEERDGKRELTAPISFLLIGSTISEEKNQGGRGQDEDGAKPGRMAYGLLIHPAEKPGEFVRVGTFESQCSQLGGLEFFDGCETKTVRLI
ncbi:HET domain-containing protein [Fusarium sp. LHS14.1]|nr:HET domain-containing protein [Fusarium sp. LHS14.1]